MVAGLLPGNGPLDRMRRAELKGHNAFRKYLEGASPSTRQQALTVALQAEEEFIAARLLYWQGVFNINPAGKAKE